MHATYAALHPVWQVPYAARAVAILDCSAERLRTRGSESDAVAQLDGGAHKKARVPVEERARKDARAVQIAPFAGSAPPVARQGLSDAAQLSALHPREGAGYDGRS